MDYAKAGLRFGKIGGILIFLLLLTAWCVDSQELICHPKQMDIVFVLDGSNSVRPWHFKSTKDAVKSMVDEFKSISADTVQIGLVQYGSIVKQEFELNQYQTKEEVNEAIDNVEYMARGTMTGAALKYLVTDTFKETHGARTGPDVEKVAVFITDGRAQDPRSVAIWHKRVKDSGIEVYVIGVGHHISDHDLQILASEPKKKHVFHVSNFQSIQSIHVTLEDDICVAEINECLNGTDNCEQICANTLGSFECSCKEGFRLEDDGFSCKPLPPTPPVRLQISDVTHTSARVSWSLGNPNGTSKVDYYTVTYQPADGSSPPKSSRVTDTETELEGLMPGTNYNISVTSHGNGLQSSPLTGNETTLFLGKTTVTVSNPTLTTLHAEWVPAGGDLLTGYSIKVHEIPAVRGQKSKIVKHASGNVKQDVRNMSITGLQPGTKYKVIVIPKHGKLSGGKGSDSGTTLQLSAPEVTIPKTTFTTAHVQWTNIGVRADNFTVRLSPTTPIDGDGEKVVTTVGTVHSTVFHGLRPGTQYTAVVFGSVTEDGSTFVSKEGNATNTTLSLVAPNVEIQTSSTSANVTWDGVGADAKLFTVRLSRTDIPNGAELVATVAGNMKSTKFTGLVPGATYRAAVVGHVIDDGVELLSPEGTANGTTTSLTAPTVTIPETTIGSVTVKWDGIGPKADKFIVYLAPANISDKSAKLNITVTGNVQTTIFRQLKPETKYVATVVGYLKDAVSPEGTATGTTRPLPSPKVTIPKTSFTTVDANWSWTVSGDILNFVVTLDRESSSDPNEPKRIGTEGDVLNTTFADLVPGQLYDVKVVGNVLDKGGIFSASAITSGRTLSLLPPNVTVSSTTFTTATVNWGGIGTDAKSFSVRLTPVDFDGETKMINTTGDTHSTVFTGLTPGTKYTATVAGFVDDGNKELSSPEGTAEGTTLSLIAPKVQIATTSTTAKVSWDGVGADAKLFTVRLRRTDVPDGAEQVASVAGNLKSTQFTGLVPGATYTATVVGHVIDNGTELLSPEGTASGTTSSIAAPNVTITETTIGSATVSWDGIGTKADKFVINLSPTNATNSGKTLNVTVDGNVQTTLFVKLKPETEYVATVVGYVDDVASPEGTALGSTLPLPHPVVSIPETSFTTLHTNWSWAVRGDIMNFIVVLYRGSYSDPDEKLRIETKGNVFKTTFTGLTPGQLYNVIVIGNVNDKGGLFGASGFARGNTLNLIAPIVTIPRTTFTTAQVDWTGIGADAERFEIHLSRADAIDGDEEKFITTKGDDRTASFTGLTPGATYTATVTGFVTDNGTDLASPVGKAEGMTLNIVAPTVTIPETTYTTARVEWTGIGAQPIRFEISLEPAGGGERKVTTSSGSMRIVAFTGLMPGTKYIANVTGFVNDGGKELASPVGSAEGTTLSLIAPVVTIPTTTFTTATVKWTSIGADAKKFQITLTSNDDAEGLKQILETGGDNRTVAFTGLQPGATYTATVVGVVDDAGLDFHSPEGKGEGTTKTPPTPTIDVTDTGLSIMDVMWTIPGDPPHEFELKYFPTKEPNNTQTVTTNDLSLRLRNLTPSTEYTIKVKAVYIDGGEKVKSPDATTTGITKSLIAPNVKVLDTSYRSGKIQWTGVGMAVHHWIIRTKILNGTGPGNLREDDATQPPGKLVADLANLEDLNEAEVIGVIVEDGKEFESPMGSTVITLDPVPPPHVNVTNSSLTTLDASWEDDIVPNQFVIRISKGMPFKLQNLEQYIEYVPGDDAKTVNGDILSNKFENLTPGTEYIVSVWAKVVEGNQEILSLSGLANGATRPLPPENLSIEEMPSRSLNITFDPPSQGQASAFEVKCVPKGTDPNTITEIEVANDSPKSTKSTTCNNLKPGVTYEVYARTMLQSAEEPPQTIRPEDYNMNKQRYGPYYSEYVKASETINVGPVNRFTLSEPTTHSLLATWQPPDHVEKVDHYILAYKLAGSDENTTELLIPGNEASKLLSILHPDTLYEADIFPVVNSVSGPKVDDSESTLKDDVSIQVVDTNFTSISLEWPISKVPGASYRIYWSPKEKPSSDEPSPPNFIDVEPGRYTMTLNNLLPATTYDISIDYVYQTAPPGKAETIGSTGLPPPGPINFTDVEDTSFVAHWGKPEFDAEPIGYHVTYTGPDGIPVSVDVVGPDTLSLEIDDAQPGSLYDINVAADYGDMGLSDDVAAKVTTDEPICSCATYVRRQQQMEKTVEKLVDIIGNLQKKIDGLQNFITIQAPTNCAIPPEIGKRDEATSVKLDANNP